MRSARIRTPYPPKPQWPQFRVGASPSAPAFVSVGWRGVSAVLAPVATARRQDPSTLLLDRRLALAAAYDAVLTCDKPSACRTSGPDMLVL